ncbi:LytTR family transcriptional regulator DNA-binding domain-containing protein [Christensenellaceae bacterium OttesenSCG-928-K19]|nr:LytTR family transcriptional regulator DNA-binding domain-containing protein [Christensenellaceae bacterium OttesenSCG-928-K19]
MKIIIEDLPSETEEHIIIRCNQVSPEIARIIAAIKSQEPLFAYSEQEICRVRLEEIFYIEAVDGKTFLYTNEKVFELKQRLYELDDELGFNFQRISKSVVLNLKKIKSLRPAINGRFEALLDNGERIIISRQYVSSLKEKFGI